VTIIDHSTRRLATFIALTLGAGLTIGYLNVPGRWYAALNKPSFNPPDWIFAPVWIALFVLIGIVGWRTWERAPASAAMILWFVQLSLNFLWSPVFFSLNRIGTALVIVVAMFATITAFIVLQWSKDRASAVLFIPYAAWVGFATVLTSAIFRLNPMR